MLSFFEIKSEKEWIELYKVLGVQSSFTQHYFYGEWHKSLGREVLRLGVKVDDKIFALMQIVKYNLFSDMAFLYIPHGPIFKTKPKTSFFKFLKEEIKKRYNNSIIFLRFDPNTEYLLDNKDEIFLKYSPIYSYQTSAFQPIHEWMLDITPTLGEILSAMHTKTRYNIRLAEKKGIKVETVSIKLLEYFEDFYDLLIITSERDKFALHSKEYYKKMIGDADSRGIGFFTIARYEDKILTMQFVLCVGDTATILLSGSSDYYRELKPTYLARHHSIIMAKNLGMKRISFGGVSVDENEYKNWSGITKYKQQFGGYLHTFPKPIDLVILPFWYRLYMLRKYFKNK